MARFIIISDESTRKRELSIRQMEVVMHALEVAVSRFDEDVKGLEEIIAEFDRAPEPPAVSESNEPGVTVIKVPMINRPGAERLKEQFERQASDAREVWNLLDGDFDEVGG